MKYVYDECPGCAAFHGDHRKKLRLVLNDDDSVSEIKGCDECGSLGFKTATNAAGPKYIRSETSDIRSE